MGSNKIVCNSTQKPMVKELQLGKSCWEHSLKLYTIHILNSMYVYIHVYVCMHYSIDYIYC